MEEKCDFSWITIALEDRNVKREWFSLTLYGIRLFPYQHTNVLHFRKTN